jgi:predicted DNA-binding protein with PD1-like motif/glutaredoxin
MPIPMAAVPLHLQPGEDVRQSLEAFARHSNSDGFVLSVVGNLSQAAFQCPGQDRPILHRGELEIITLAGTLSATGVHLHLSFSDGDCRVWGGHLEPGTLVLKGADLLVGLLQAIPPKSLAVPAIRVQIAVREGCPYSARALRLLRTLGIPHQHVQPEPGRPVPQISIDGRAVGGYDALAELHGRGELEALRAL